MELHLHNRLLKLFYSSNIDNDNEIDNDNDDNNDSNNSNSNDNEDNDSKNTNNNDKDDDNYNYNAGNKYRKSHDRECISWFMGTSDVLKVFKIARAISECNLKSFQNFTSDHKSRNARAVRAIFRLLFP